MPSLFDPASFLETSHKGNLDTSVVLVPEGDYLAQCTDKIDIKSGTIGEGKSRAGEPWANVSLLWEVMNRDDLKTSLNMDRILVRQSIMLDLTDAGQIDLGTNKNMRLKRLLDATGLNSTKNWSLAQLKFTTAGIHVKHNKPDGFDDFVAEVDRVTSVSKFQEKVAA